MSQSSKNQFCSTASLNQQHIINMYNNVKDENDPPITDENDLRVKTLINCVKETVDSISATYRDHKNDHISDKLADFLGFSQGIHVPKHFVKDSILKYIATHHLLDLTKTENITTLNTACTFNKDLTLDTCLKKLIEPYEQDTIEFGEFMNLLNSHFISEQSSYESFD